MFVGPTHRQFQRASGVEAGRAGIGVDGGLGFRRGLEYRRPLALEEDELTHTLPPRTRSTSRPNSPRSRLFPLELLLSGIGKGTTA